LYTPPAAGSVKRLGPLGVKVPPLLSASALLPAMQSFVTQPTQIVSTTSAMESEVRAMKSSSSQRALHSPETGSLLRLSGSE